MDTITQSYLLEESPCDSADKDIFTNGDCWKLARLLHDRGVGELVIVADFEDPIDSWCHMAVELPDGNYLDVLGVYTRQQFENHWFRHCWGSNPIIHKPKVTTASWYELTNDQEADYTSAEDIETVAQNLIEWFADTF